MPDIEYTATDERDMDLIAGMWMKLNKQHEAGSRHFSGRFAVRTFEWRKNKLLEKAKAGLLRIDLAGDRNSGDYIGYCVGSVSADKQGEIESIFVEAEYRGSGIGERLMKNSLDWMDGHGVTGKILGVAGGNEGVFGFYSRFNFYPRNIILEQVNE